VAERPDAPTAAGRLHPRAVALVEAELARDPRLAERFDALLANARAYRRAPRRGRAGPDVRVARLLA
jgi:hypothetical protein